MKIIISLSGGLDSAVLLADCIARHHEVVAAVGFNYGSKHNPFEHEAARKLCGHYGITYNLLDLRPTMVSIRSNLLASGGAIPEGHYEEESMKLTVVPGRNLIFISVLAGVAWSYGAEAVFLGVHAGDHFIYPDCRPDFIHAMMSAVRYGTDQKVTLATPFLDMAKWTIVARGLALKVPFEKTRTCYTNKTLACGRCGSCVERREAFDLNKTKDPLEYLYDGPLPSKPKGV